MTEGRILIRLTIWCGGDCVWGEDLKATSKIQAHKEAKAKGWKLTRSHGWLCPDCAKEQEALREAA